MQTDILIIGAGMVGASLAIALGKLAPELKVAVVEPIDVSQKKLNEPQVSYDQRSTVLSYGSRLIYEQLDLWKDIAKHCNPIQTIDVREQGQFGFTKLTHKEQNVPALGYVLKNHDLGRVLLDKTLKLDNLQLISPASAEQISWENGKPKVCIKTAKGEQICHPELLVLADGGRSPLTAQLGLYREEKDYQQKAIVTSLKTSAIHDNQAFELFTQKGAMALLPLQDPKQSAMIWTLPEEQAQEYLTNSKEAFLQTTQNVFGDSLGRFIKLGERFSYPLLMRQLKEQVRPNLVVLGNAAHTLHPVAGQGYNLCLRDLIVLAQNLAKNHSKNKLPGDFRNLLAYQEARLKDQQHTSLACDWLIRCFSQDSKALRTARNLGLLGLNYCPPIKKWFANQAMGLRG